MNRSIAAVVLLLTLSVVLSVGTVHAAPVFQGATLPPGVVDVEWSLTSLQPPGAAAEDTTGKGLTLTLDSDGTAYGSGGCNRFTTGYTVGEGQSLTFTPIAGTLMACEQSIADLEQSYFVTLQAVTAYSFEDGRLVLQAGANGELVFSAPGTAPAQLPETGVDGRWSAWIVLAAVLSLVAGLLVRQKWVLQYHAGA